MAMPDSSPQDIPETADWEAFYTAYRKPGYIPGYEILHKLGGGVFGIVYKSRKQSIGKAYAIKFLKVDDHGVRSQVMAEMDMVKLFACVDHPNLVSIEDMGSVDGIPYITMGFAGEETLKSRLEEGPLAEEEALRLFVQIARGVQALHEHSLSHFDLKPANIFLKGDIARVGDYGLSKLVTESCMSLTFGRGTPYYMAPEIMSRKGDQRSDIYSLGVILYECLCGEVPFQGETEWEVIEGHRKKPLVCPDHLSVQYRRILERMMAKEPGERYPSIAHMLKDLRRKNRLGESLVLEFGTGEVRSGIQPPPIPPRPAVQSERILPPDPMPLPRAATETERDILRVDLPGIRRRDRRSGPRRRITRIGVAILALSVSFLVSGVVFLVAQRERVAQRRGVALASLDQRLQANEVGLAEATAKRLSSEIRVVEGSIIKVDGKRYDLARRSDQLRFVKEKAMPVVHSILKTVGVEDLQSRNMAIRIVIETLEHMGFPRALSENLRPALSEVVK